MELQPDYPSDRKRLKYDSTVAWLYIARKEHLLPESFRQTIPASTISTWRKLSYSSYYGSDFHEIQKESLEWYELLHKHQRLQKTIRVIAKTWIMVSDMIIPLVQKNKENTSLFTNAIQELLKGLTKKTVCGIAGISLSGLHYRIMQVKYKCDNSLFALCLKNHPLQLTASEIKKVKDAFSNPLFACWPSISIYYKLLREKELCIGLSTFYKYVQLLGLKQKWAKAHTKTSGIVSFAPNQYFHVDTTFWEYLPGSKAAIVFVSDNFSKAVLGWNVSLKHGSENVKEALQKAIASIAKFHPGHLCPVTLVADGGSENNSVTIDELLKSCKSPPIRKVIAQKDILYSNSPTDGYR